MIRNTDEIIDLLIKDISSISKVQSIGISGSKTPFPRQGEGDIDIFIYCDTIPSYDKRAKIIEHFGDILQGAKVNVFQGGHWGVGDFALVNGVETWFMYFTSDETLKDIKAILSGEYPDKQDNYYYPIGRCAMLKGINILFDRNNFLTSLKEELLKYPEDLSKKLVAHHLDKLEDVEDLERAVIRKDVLFYHFAIDLAIDHFLMALFALNKTFFPSRKRTIQYINSFNQKPAVCEERLLEVIKLGAEASSIKKSYELWCAIVEELMEISMKYI